MKAIKWGDIIAEVGNYRDGFVAVFRQYEGRETDERDAQGRVVKVTASSFARHMGIPVETFRGWTRVTSAVTQPRPKDALTRDVSRAARNEPEAVVAGIMAASAEAQDAILDGLQSKLIERMDLPFGGDIPKVPGEDRPVVKAAQIRSLCASILAKLGVLEVVLAEAGVDDIDEVSSSLATVNHRAAEVTGPFVPSADTVEQFLKDRTV